MDFILTVNGYDAELDELFEHKEKLTVNHPQEVGMKVAGIMTAMSSVGLTRQTGPSAWRHTAGRNLGKLVANVSSIMLVGANEAPQLIGR